MGERTLEFQMKCKDDHYIWLEGKIKSFIDIDGLYKTLIVSREIPEPKRKVKKTSKEKKKNFAIEEKYHLISENVNDLIIVINRRFKFEYVNEGPLFKMLGYSREELFDKRPIDFIHPNDFKFSVSQFQKGFREGKFHVETRIKHKEGNYIWVEINGSIFLDKNKRPKIFLIARNITERIEAIQKLRESEEKFRNITEQSLMGICILQDNVIKYVNKKFADIIGYTLDEMMNWSPNKFIKAIHPEDREMVVEQAIKKQQGDKDVLVYYPFRGIKKTGETIWVDNFSKSIIYRGKPADLITVIDITEQKRAEEHLKESEKKYRYLFEKSPFSVILVDPEGKIVDCNPATEELIQYKKDEIIGKKFTNLTIVPQKYMPILIERLKLFLKAGILSPIEIQLYKKDGSLIWARLQSSLIKLGDTILNQVIGYDITERKTAEKVLKESENKFRRIFEAIPDLFFLVSNDATVIDYKRKEDDLYVPPRNFSVKN